MTERQSDAEQRAYEEQMHFMGRQAQMLAEEGNDVSARVMHDAIKVLMSEHNALIAAIEGVHHLHEELDAAQSEIAALRAAPPSSESPIGEVVGHEAPGRALVQWKDNGLRPLGMLLYAFPQPTSKEPSAEAVAEGSCYDPDEIRVSDYYDFLQPTSEAPYVKRYGENDSPQPTSQEPQHVCGLQGYNPMIDPPCPGCEERFSKEPK